MTADDWCDIRNILVDEMQCHLKDVRCALGFTGDDLGDILGVTRQTISNLENKRTKMSVVQYIAIRHLLDEYMDIYPENVLIKSLCGRLDCNLDRPWTNMIFSCRNHV